MNRGIILLIGTVVGAFAFTSLTLFVHRDGEQLLCSPPEPLITTSINLSPPTGPTYKAIDKGWPFEFYRDTSLSKNCNPPTNPKTTNYVNWTNFDKDLAVGAVVAFLITSSGLLVYRGRK